MDCRVAGAAVSTVEPTIEFKVAVMLLVPLEATTVARPPLDMVATNVVADAQVTDAVRFCVLLSLKVPVAVNCSVKPFATVGFAGVTAMDCRVAGAAVSTVEPTIEFKAAMMLLVPLAATTVARPPLEMVATDVVADAQVTEAVRFCVLLSV
jgi:hypothetical protein